MGGPGDALDALAAAAERQGLKMRRLAVPAPFHTPLMQGAAGRLRAALTQVAIRPPMVPVLSVVTNRRASRPDEIRENLAAHMTHPVRFVDLIRGIVDEAESVLIEVGPQQVLTGLNRQILHGRGVALIASDNPRRPGVEALLSVQAMLDCAGALEKETMEPSSQHSAVAPSAAQPARQILSFDATARRRDKMRQAGAKQPVAPRATVVPATVPVPAAAAEHDGNGQHQAEDKTTGAAGANLESFLINFVVDQTGYPSEVVELDADLEADLGIDSIKKAQLFGELREYFDVTPSENLTLDDFPTLRHVLRFLQGVPIRDGAPLAEQSVPPPAETTTVAAVERPAPPATAPQPTPVAAASVTAVLEPAGPSTAPAATELESFLINFVVEQTGYPSEVVELDADLEADLGIDSIKKAQLFGELREYFDVTPSENLTLDDFPTLRHVLRFLQGVPIRDGAPLAEQSVPPPAETTTVAAVERPAPPATAPQPTPVAAASVTAVLEPAGPSTAPAATELESFLIYFVVEQTGYPSEVVELDADLEADLGIDSIKKAQLFGELREYFDVTPSENLTLDDFPTLRHVLRFLQGVPIRDGASPTEQLAVSASATTQAAPRRPDRLRPPAPRPTRPDSNTDGSTRLQSAGSSGVLPTFRRPPWKKYNSWPPPIRRRRSITTR